MIGKRDKFRGGFEKQSALKLRWRQAADCSRGGIRQPETHDRQQWTAVYVGSLAARMTTTGDSGGWNRRRSGCNRKDTVAPDRAGIGKWAQLTWNRCVPETAASVVMNETMNWCVEMMGTNDRSLAEKTGSWFRKKARDSGKTPVTIHHRADTTSSITEIDCRDLVWKRRNIAISDDGVDITW